jgi:hypothetical protein
LSRVLSINIQYSQYQFWYTALCKPANLDHATNLCYNVGGGGMTINWKRFTPIALTSLLLLMLVLGVRLYFSLYSPGDASPPSDTAIITSTFTPPPSATPTPTSTPTGTPVPTPYPSPTPTPSPTFSPTATATAGVTPTPTETPEPIPTLTPALAQGWATVVENCTNYRPCPQCPSCGMVHRGDEVFVLGCKGAWCSILSPHDEWVRCIAICKDCIIW